MQVTVRFENSRSTKNNVVYAVAEGHPYGIVGTLYVPKRLAGKKPAPFYEFGIEIAETEEQA